MLLKPVLGRGLVPDPHFTIKTLGGSYDSPGTSEEWERIRGLILK